jgi:hypothetical protein
MNRDTALLLRAFVLMLILVLVVWMLGGCAAAAPALHPTFPDDMRLVCHEGAYYLGSVSADQVVRLPLSCT